MFIVKFAALATALISMLPLASAASASPVCAFDVFEPQALTRELTASLPSVGIAVVSLDDKSATASRSNARLLLVRDGAIVGELYSATDVRAAKAEMTVLSASGDVLMHFEESRRPCRSGRSAGMCSHIEGFTELEAPLDHLPAYRLEVGPDKTFPTYYRYDARVNSMEYRDALLSSLDWLTATLDSTDITRQPVNITPESQVYWALASNPDVAPYLDRFTISSQRDHLVIKGVVPSNFIYDQVVQAALHVGLWRVVPDLIIDTRTDTVDMSPTVTRCL